MNIMIKMSTLILILNMVACSATDDLTTTQMNAEISNKLSSSTEQQKACFQRCLASFKGAQSKAKKTCLRRLDRLIINEQNGKEFDSKYCFGGH